VKIIVAPDSFKESLSAADAARAIAEGVRVACPQADIRCIPMADGGEGTVAAVLAAMAGESQGQWRYTAVHGALDDWAAPERLRAGWGWLHGDTNEPTAVIEMAAAAGLEQTPAASRDPMRASSVGVGELIRAALDAGARRIILGLGGSSCNDGGAGMLCALGVRLFDAAGRDLPPGGAALASLADIDVSGLDARLREVVIEVASDVDNPLTGPNGATYIFGPQKGASHEQLAQLDAALARFGELSTQLLGRDLRDAPGAGAAGGLGYAALAYLGARFRPGVAVVAELGGLADAMAGAALAFTRLSTWGRQFKDLSGAYFTTRWQTLAWLALIVFLVLFGVRMTVLFTMWFNTMYTSLQKLDEALFWFAMRLVALLATIDIIRQMTEY